MNPRLVVSVAGDAAWVAQFQEKIERHFVGFTLQAASARAWEGNTEIELTWSFGRVLTPPRANPRLVTRKRGKMGRPKGTHISDD
jgi:hypothetical protein